MSEFAIMVFPDAASACAAVHSLHELHRDGLALVHGAVLVERDEKGALSVKERRGEVPLGLGVGALVDALLGRVERELAPGTFAVIAELPEEERGTRVDAAMEALGGTIVGEWDEDSLDDVLTATGDVSAADRVATRAERLAAEAERISSKLAQVVEGEREKLERAAAELRERLDDAKQELRVRIDAIEERAARAPPELAGRVGRHLAAVRAELGERDQKLERACDLAREAIRPKTT